MTGQKTLQRVLGFCALMLVAACGTDKSITEAATLVRNSIQSAASGGAGQAGGISQEAIDRALAELDQPLVLLQNDKTGAQSLAFEAERNRGYRTYATGNRTTLTFRDGIITATRGLGGDLMSSEEDALLAMVTARRTGQAPYVLRFLDGENQTRNLAFDCTVTRGDTAPVALGEINAQTQIMIATCRGSIGRFTNRFFVTRSGTIVASRQWVGAVTGYLVTQQLRL